MNVLFSCYHLPAARSISCSAGVRFPVCPSTLVAYKYDNINTITLISGIDGVLTVKTDVNSAWGDSSSI